VSGSGISWAYASLHPRSRQITTPAPPPLSFLEAGCPSCRPTNSVKAHRYDTVKTVKSRTLLTRQNCSESSKALATYQLIDEVLVWLSVCSEVQIVCIMVQLMPLLDYTLHLNSTVTVGCYQRRTVDTLRSTYCLFIFLFIYLFLVFRGNINSLPCVSVSNSPMSGLSHMFCVARTISRAFSLSSPQ